MYCLIMHLLNVIVKIIWTFSHFNYSWAASTYLQQYPFYFSSVFLLRFLSRMHMQSYTWQLYGTSSTKRKWNTVTQYCNAWLRSCTSPCSQRVAVTTTGWCCQLCLSLSLFFLLTPTFSGVCSFRRYYCLHLRHCILRRLPEYVWQNQNGVLWHTRSLSCNGPKELPSTLSWGA